MGLVANSSQHPGGAIDSDASDKLAHFLQLCDAFGVPIVSLCDTPGFMNGKFGGRWAVAESSR